MYYSSNTEREAINALAHICEHEQERNYLSMKKFFEDLFTVFHNFNKSIKEPLIESTYAGVHLTQTYNEEEFIKMIEQFYAKKIIHAKYALQILRDAIKKQKTYSNIEKCNLNDSKLNKVVIVGDLHGSFKDLHRIIKKYGIPGKEHVFIFNGDYVDRGFQQSEVLLTILYAHLLNPTRVFINRGNHEDVWLNMSKQFKPNFSDDCKDKFKQNGYLVFREAHELFKYLPLATILTNSAGFRCFVVHGGVSDKTDLNFIKSNRFKRHDFISITRATNDEKSINQFLDLMWSDPIDRNGCVPNRRRGAGTFFGPDVSEEFCKKNHFDAIVRSHQCREYGWSKDHSCCYTVFSCSHYCNGDNNAAVLILGQNDKKFETYSFDAYIFEDSININSFFEKSKINLLATFKSLLEKYSYNLLELFKKADSDDKGWIKVSDWAQIISEYLETENISIQEKYLIELKDYLLPFDKKTNMVNYEGMFNKSVLEPVQNVHNLLDDIFKLIDINHDGVITKREANKIIKYINSNLGTSYSKDMISQIDKNKDGQIDINDFKEAFGEAFHLKKLKTG